MHVLILRDPRESAAKCSLTPLRGLPDIEFKSYRFDRRHTVGRRLFLTPDGEPFGEADRGLDLFLIDCAWRRVPKLLATVDGDLLPRRLPELRSAYPRKSKLFEDPGSGLASIEALYAAVCLLDGPRSDLLRDYRWREAFLEANPELPR